MSLNNRRSESDGGELRATAPGSVVGASGRRLVVRRERRIVRESAIERLRLVTVGEHGVSLSTNAIALCADAGLRILIVDGLGLPRAVAGAPGWCDATTGAAQVRALADMDRTVDLAGRIVRGKLAAQAATIRYFSRRRGRNTEFAAVASNALDAIRGLAGDIGAIRADGDLLRAQQQLFAIEGRGAGAYWQVVAVVLREHAAFPGRRRRGATDLVNSMLNYGYAVLQGRILLAILHAGLNPNVSVLHSASPRRPALAFDLIEEFRAPVVDRPVVGLATRHRNLKVDAAGHMDDVTRRLVLDAVRRRLATLVRYRGQDRTIDEVILLQARHWAACLLDNRRYRPFAAGW